MEQARLIFVPIVRPMVDDSIEKPFRFYISEELESEALFVLNRLD